MSPLGDYELHLESGAGGLSATVRTLKGPLHLAGKVSRGTAGPPRFGITARIDPQFEPQLAPFLRLIAIERGAGNFELQMDQNFGQSAGTAAGSLSK